VSRKSKGINAERELIHKFWSNGWSACRIAGSGSMRYPSPDIIAGNNVRKIAIECKATKEIRQYFTKKEICELKEFCRLFGAEPWTGVKFDRVDWYFLTVEDLENNGEGYSISIEGAKRKGFVFEELAGFILNLAPQVSARLAQCYFNYKPDLPVGDKFACGQKSCSRAATNPR
jgi:Holliday junction resolvase